MNTTNYNKSINLRLHRTQDKNMLRSAVISQSDKQKNRNNTLHEIFGYFLIYQFRLYSSKAFQSFFFQFSVFKNTLRFLSITTLGKSKSLPKIKHFTQQNNPGS